jgi:hypothetical protein
LDVVDVSGANQYRVKPAELVTTWVPPIVRTIRVVPDELDDAPAAGVPLGAAALDELELDELAQAVRASTAAARLATIKCLRMGRSSPLCLSPL